MKRLVAVVVVLACAGLATADDKANPTGTWKYTTEANGQSLDVVIKLKLEGDKLTGTVGINEMDSKIEDGKFKDGQATWKVNFDFGGNKIGIKYDVKVSGDTMKGKREIDRDGQTTTREFEAKRSKTKD